MLEHVAMKMLTQMCNETLETGIWSKDFTKIILILVTKTPRVIDCKNNRTISLISHTSKDLLGIIERKIATRIEEHLTEEQFGFRSKRGTRDAVTAIIKLSERFLDYLSSKISDLLMTQ